MRRVYSLIEAEEERQKRKMHGRGSFSASVWLAFLVEEVGELSMALTGYHFRGRPRTEIVRQAIQVAALAIKIAEDNDHDE